MTFDYKAAAELYPSKSLFKTRQVKYQRFASAAEALKYAMEDMPAELLRGSLLEVGEERYEGAAIKELYESDAYPLPRSQT